MLGLILAGSLTSLSTRFVKCHSLRYGSLLGAYCNKAPGLLFLHFLHVAGCQLDELQISFILKPMSAWQTLALFLLETTPAQRALVLDHFKMDVSLMSISFKSFRKRVLDGH